MKLKILILLVLSYGLILGEYGEVLTLDDETLEEALDSCEILLLKFFTPDSQACQDMADAYGLLAEEVSQKELPYLLAEYDISQSTTVHEQYDLKSYPTLFLFLNRSPLKYMGGLHVADIQKFIAEKSRTVVRLSTEDEIRQVIKERHLADIFFFAERGSEVQEIGDSLGEKMSDMKGIKIYAVENPLLLQAFSDIEEANPPFPIVLSHTQEGKISKLSIDVTLYNIEAFITKNSLPPVPPFDNKIMELLNTEKEIGIGILLFRNHESALTKDIEFDFARFAHRNLDNIQYFFRMDDVLSNDGKNVADTFGINEGNFPIICMFVREGDLRKFIINKQAYELTYEGMNSALRALINGKLHKTYKSDPVPEIQDEFVFTLVGQTFAKEVYNSGKDILVHFYLPWSGSVCTIYIIFSQRLSTN